ncbi:hypothetical protein AURDEDRAFT_22573, partial [Auricularia subglabra TFB-10046 SS5]
GLALHSITQGLAHKAISFGAVRMGAGRRATDANVAKIKADIAELCGKAPTTRQIWQDLGDRALTRQCRYFLWKAIHGVHKTGEYFEKMKMPWKGYAKCPSCGVTESLDHVLLRCTHSGQQKIWELVTSLFAKK